MRKTASPARQAWCEGFGRLGGVGGPLLGGFLIGAGLALNSIFYFLAGLGLLGLVLTLLVPVAYRPRELRSTNIEPTPAVAARTRSGYLASSPGSPAVPQPGASSPPLSLAGLPVRARQR